METGTARVCSDRTDSTASVTYRSNPYRGGRNLPVRVRPPSIDHTRLRPLATIWPTSARRASRYTGMSAVARRTGMNPLRRANVPSGKKLRLAPASPNVGEMPSWEAWREGELIQIGAVRDQKDQGVVAVEARSVARSSSSMTTWNPRTIHADHASPGAHDDRNVGCRHLAHVDRCLLPDIGRVSVQLRCQLAVALRNPSELSSASLSGHCVVDPFAHSSRTRRSGTHSFRTAAGAAYAIASDHRSPAATPGQSSRVSM